jgi:phenylalanyl-tRNA synthetase alpha chain
MLQIIDQILEEARKFNATTPEEIEKFRIKYLGKKGVLAGLFMDFKQLPAEQKREVGQKINQLKEYVSGKIDEMLAFCDDETGKDEPVDLTLPGEPIQLGARHPISIVRNQIIDIFGRLGYTISEGPEIEDDWHLFSALNFPPEHPARDMQDTFFIEKDPDIMLRTHTSSVQVRVMEKEQPPIRTISPGRVFRNEAISARAHCIFHQVEVRLRPSFFPFTEPSAEMDISCQICGGKGCNVCKYTGWLEILGCGMVDPNVLDFTNIDSTKYTGFAFGMGIERVAMLKYQVRDLRLYFENDVRFLAQFTSAY